MNLRSLFTLIILTATLTMGCRKKDSSNNPCEGVLNESPPVTAILKIVDKTTGENLLTNGTIKETDVTVIYKHNNKDPKNWYIFKTDPNTTSPYHGTLRFSIFNETEGQHLYQVQLGSKGSATLSYTVTEKKTENPCKPYAYPISDFKLTDHPFTLMEIQGKEQPNFLVLAL